MHFPPFTLLTSPCANDDSSDVGILLQLSCYICPEDVGFEDGTWGICYLRWQGHSVDPHSIFCAVCHFVLIALRESRALWSLCAQLLGDIACISKNPVNVTLVPYIPEVLYVVGSLQWPQRNQPLF